MNAPRVVVTYPFFPPTFIEKLKSKFVVILTNTKEEALQNVLGADAILCTPGTITIDKDIMDKAGKQLKLISTFSVGYDHIDVDEAKKRGIRVLNARGVFDDAVADMAIYLLIGAARHGHAGRLIMEQGVKNDNLLGLDIKGSTVGIVGLGAIGQKILKRLKSFDIGKFLYTGRGEKPEGGKLGAHYVDFKTLVTQSDFIIIACELNSQTKLLFNSEIFKMMKSTTVLVNIARGEIVDQDALIEALKTKRIWGAGLDVTTPEPLPPDSELLKVPNAVLMPHLAYGTQGAVKELLELGLESMVRVLNGDEPLTPYV